MGLRTYFWGTDTDPVDPSASPFMNYCGNGLATLWCPEFRWGDYAPQGAVNEPTTTYGYNGYYLDPSLDGTTCRPVVGIPRPGDLFVFADSACYSVWFSVPRFQNSTYLEPVTGNAFQTPTNHFRHQGKTNALCADGHAQTYGSEGWTVNPTRNLGFVGTKNDPHYAQ